MYKKYLYIVLALLFLSCGALWSQAIIYEEDFTVDTGEWDLNGNWEIAYDSLILEHDPEVINYDMSATSPVIALTENPGDMIITQQVNQFVFAHDGEFFEIAIINDDQVDVLWLHTENENWGDWTGSDLILSLADYNDQDIQIRFRSAGGSTDNINGWNIFNILIEGSFDNDLAAVDIVSNFDPVIGSNIPFTITVRNEGANSQDNYEVVLRQADGSVLNSIEADILLETGDEADFNLFWTPASGGYYSFYGEVILAGDENESNNITEILEIYVPYHYDVAVLNLTGDTDLVLGEEAEFLLYIQNIGSNSISSSELTLQLVTDEGEILDYFSPFFGFLEPGQETYYELYFTPDELGELIVMGEVIYQFDQNPDNNVSEPLALSTFIPNSVVLDIGPDDDWDKLPFSFNSRYSYTQMIYLDSELTETGFIDQIGFVYNFSELTADIPIRVYLGETVLDFFTDDFVDHDQLTEVFDGYLDFDTGLNYYHISLDEPYYYDGGNLVVAISRVYNWHTDDNTLRDFNGGQISSPRTLNTRGSHPIDPGNPGWIFPESYQVRTRFVFNTSGTGQLTGNVDNDFGTSLENAQIRLTSVYQTTLSGTDGTFHFPQVYQGQFNVRVSKPGYIQQKIENVLIEEDAIANLNVTLDVSSGLNTPPENLMVTSYQRNNVHLSWDAPATRTNRNLLGYNVYRDNIRLNTQLLSEGEYIDTNLPVGSYQYFVTAFYTGNEESIESDIFTIDVNDLYVPRITNILMGNDGVSNKIRWDIILREGQNREDTLRNLIGYNIYRDNELLNSEPIPSASHSEYLDHTASNLVNHQYTVTAVYTEGESDYSPTYEYFTIFAPYDIYALPWGDYIEIHWSAPPEPVDDGYLVGYNVYNALIGDVLLNPEPITDEFFVIEDVTLGEEFRIFVTAVYNLGESDFAYIIVATGGESEVNTPYDLDGTVEESNVLLTWERPQETGSWVNWDEDEAGGEFGFSDGEEFIAAVHFDEWDLINYDYHRITEVAFHTADVTADYSLIVWGIDFLDPDGDLVIILEEELTDIEPDSWNYIRLDNHHGLINNQNMSRYTFGIKYSNYSDAPAVFDSGNNVSPKSDKIMSGGTEQNLSDHDIDANWRIRIFMYPLEQILPSEPLGNGGRGTTIRSGRNADLYVTGYNLYRNDSFISFIHHLHEDYHDPELEDGSYTYYLTAVYEVLGIGATLESEASQSLTVDIETVNIEDGQIGTPYVTELVGNYPNPFNPETAILFSLQEKSNVRIDIYNLRGQKVKTLINNEMPAGQHRLVWRGNSDDGRAVSSGVYFYRMTADNFNETRKMLLLK